MEKFVTTACEVTAKADSPSISAKAWASVVTVLSGERCFWRSSQNEESVLYCDHLSPSYDGLCRRQDRHVNYLVAFNAAALLTAPLQQPLTEESA